MKIAIPIWKSHDDLRYVINVAYIDYIAGAGLTPVIITPENIDITSECDGLLLPGGIDIDPIYYNEENIGSFSTDFEKDEYERRLLNSFIESGKPVFGICRGFQLVAREFLITHPKAEGLMTFYQHVNEHNGPANYKVKRSQPIHFVDADAGLWNEESDKKITYPVNSMHHQALVLKNRDNKFKTAEGKLYVAGITNYGLSDSMSKSKSVIIEAIILRLGKCKITAVQWHPEEMKDYALLIRCFSGVGRETDDKSKLEV